MQGDKDLKPGTAIATFNENGHYFGHAAIYLGQDEKGIQVIDQWNRRDKDGNIKNRHPPSERTLPFNRSSNTDPVDRGESYRVVK